MPAKIPDQLKEVVDQMSKGNGRTETVRTLLSWFGFQRRGYWQVHQIRKALNKVKLKTDPDFDQAWIDATIAFITKPKINKAVGLQETIEISDEDLSKVHETGDAAPVSKKSLEDVNSRIKIGMLAAANRPPLCTSPDAKVSEAVTLMLQNDYSQLPVTTSAREVRGIISWKSLGSRLALGKRCDYVRECSQTASEVRFDASLFEAIQQIVEHDCVLVRDNKRTITGIVTTADLSFQFAQLGEPFLLLGQIENHIRDLIANKFTKTELASMCDPADSNREIDDVADLSLGEYIRLLENPTRWEKFAIQIDRKTFIEELTRVGHIRNDVMHFDPDGVGPDDLASLRKFAHFLGDLQEKLA